MKKQNKNQQIQIVKCNKIRQMLGLIVVLLAFGVNCLFAEGINSRGAQLDIQDVKQNSRITVGGIVKDKTGEPLVGVSVVIRGTTQGSITDIDGKYSLQVEPNASLVFSYIGHITQTILVNNKNSIDVIMLDDSHLLGEVVIEVGYGAQKKVNLTGAISSVDMGKALGDRPITTVQAALQGSVPGLLVSNDINAPGSTYEMSIRGTGTVSPNPKQPRKSDPLVVVDNIPIDDLSLVNPEDIETVNVLKDAASSAIYGARAAFGVILITTKKGAKEQKTRFNYSNNFSFRNPLELPKKGSPTQHVQFLKDVGAVDYIAAAQNVDKWLGLLGEYNADPSKYPLGYYIDEKGVRYELAERDMYADMTETGVQQTHNLSISGGTKAINYRMSFGYDDEDGVLVTNKDSYKRYNASSIVGADVTDWMRAQMEVSYASGTQSDPYETLNFNGGNVWATASNFASYYPLDGMDINDQYYLFTTPKNILNRTEMPNKKRTDNLRLFGKVIFTPLKGMTVVGEYAYNNMTKRNEKFTPVVTMANGQIYATATNATYSTYKKAAYFTGRNTLNAYATYDFSLGSNNFTLMGGFNQESFGTDYLYGQNTNMISDQLPSLNGGTGQMTTAESDDDYTVSEYSVRGLFYRVNYNYKGKYLLEANGRYDGSSKFPKESRFGFFPSFSGAWRISEESFMESTRDLFSNIKLRASWGNIGNQNINPYEYMQNMSSDLGIWSADGITRVRYLKVPSLVSGNFTWESIQTLDFGIDLGLLSNRFTTTFDWYTRENKGMLGPEFYPNTIGVETKDLPYSNSSDMRTQGWELQVGWNDVIGDFRYGAVLNISDYQSEITRYNNPSKVLKTGDDWNYYTGKKLNEIWGYTYDRLYTIDDFVAGTVDPVTMKGNGQLKPGIPKVKGSSPNPGDILYKYPDKDGLISDGEGTADNPGSMRVIGNSTPRYQYGLILNAGWKGFDLSVFLQGVAKRDLPWRKDNLVFPFASGDWGTLYANQTNYWTPTNLESEYPRYYYNGGGIDNYSRTADRYILDGAYLRLKNITLSYTFEKKMVSRLHLNNLKVFFSGENLHTWDNLPQGIDPQNTPRDGGAIYPVMRALSFGINVGI